MYICKCERTYIIMLLIHIRQAFRANGRKFPSELQRNLSIRSLNENSPAITSVLAVLGSVISVGLYVKSIGTSISADIKLLDTKMSADIKSLDTKMSTDIKLLDTKIDTSINSLRDILLNHEGRIATNSVKVDLFKPRID